METIGRRNVYTGGVHLRALSATPESIVRVYLLYGKTTSSGKVCGFLCSGRQRSEVHPPCILVRGNVQCALLNPQLLMSAIKQICN